MYNRTKQSHVVRVRQKSKCFLEHSVCNWHIYKDVHGDRRVCQTQCVPHDETFSGILHLSFCGLWLFAHAIGRKHVRVIDGLLENQLHVRWIIWLVRRDTKHAVQGERDQTQEGLPSCAKNCDIEIETTWLHFAKTDAPRHVAQKKFVCL